MNFITLPSREALQAEAANQIADALRAGLAARGAACAVLSGGSSGEAYEPLSRLALDWPRITFALADERFVPVDAEPSNEGMLRRRLARALDAGARIAPMYAPVATVDDAAAQAEHIYASLTFDIAVLGMGPDGHTASWFPGSADLTAALDPQTPRSVIAARAALAYGTPERLTLTLPAIARAKRVLLLIAGDDKRARLEQALREDDAPVAALFKPPLQTQVLWAR